MKFKSDEELLKDIDRLNLKSKFQKRHTGVLLGKDARKKISQSGAPLPSPSQGEEETNRPQRRLEDSLPLVDPGVKRSIYSWAFWHNLQMVGIREWLESLLSLFSQKREFYVSKRFLKQLVAGRSVKSISGNYSLLDTLADLVVIARQLLGGESKEFKQNIKVDLEREAGHFAIEYLNLFVKINSEALKNLHFLKQITQTGQRILVSQLAWAVKVTYGLILTIEQVEPTRVMTILKTACRINIRYIEEEYKVMPKRKNELVQEFQLFEPVFERLLENLKRFKYEMYPALLFMINGFYPYQDSSNYKRDKILNFLNMTVNDVLTYQEYVQRKNQEIEKKWKARQLQEIERLEREKTEDFRDKFKEILLVLNALFPDSGIANLDREYLLPYFYNFFGKDLRFSEDVRDLSGDDPFRVIYVFHHIGWDLLSAIDGMILGRVLTRGDLRNELAELKLQWREIQPKLFDKYLDKIHFVAKRTETQENKRQFERNYANKVEFQLNDIRKNMIAHYQPFSNPLTRRILEEGGADLNRFYGPKLYELVARTYDFACQISVDIHSGIFDKKSKIEQKLLGDLSKFQIVDFNSYTTPGTVEFKPCIRQIVRYAEAKHHKKISNIIPETQVTFFEVFRDYMELYHYLLNDSNSMLARSNARVAVAELEEEEIWAEEERKRSRGYKIHVHDDPDKYYDMLTAVYNRQKIETLAKEMLESLPSNPRRHQLCIAMGDIDHFKSFNDNYGHQTGDLVLKTVAETISSNLERNCQVGRYGGEEFLMILPKGFSGALINLERIRAVLESRRISIEADGEKREIQITMSLGMVDCQGIHDYDKAINFADKALYAAKDAGRNKLLFYNLQQSGDNGPVFTSFDQWVDYVKGSSPSPQP